ncbi:PAS domain-containing sensor histidine kinase [Lutibacter flavus]|uniref:histidine kinase n=1 Tax=Lutibacter flavus TaxID=691689 RepID=A0A238VSA6_9FLAO|nr:PAS domain-containing sensor histidine kinase [Lutibacter flavus]SNR37054.1 PAS domain S-box-containing protein [Lutibacter flavus]
MPTLNPYSNEEVNKYYNDANFIHLDKIPNKAIVICDQQGIIISANLDFCALVGLEVSELEGTQMKADLFLKIGILKDANSLNKLLNWKRRDYEIEFLKKNGTSVIIEIKKERIRDNNCAFFFNDITKQTQLQTKLEAVTIKLAKLNEDKSRFISVLAHDLKSPFNSILGFVTLLKENYSKCSREEIEKYISYIDGASQNAYNLLEDTLAWIGAENGKFKIAKEDFEINSLILAALKDLSLIAHRKNINMCFDNKDQIMVYCDANMIKMVLRNLLSNAIKFTNKDGEIHITIADDPTETKVSIKDNGVGISEDSMLKLFDIKGFYSTKGTELEKGTGMGLVLCKEFIEKHNGTLSLDSNVGVGSTFTFTIPKIA